MEVVFSVFILIERFVLEFRDPSDKNHWSKTQRITNQIVGSVKQFMIQMDADRYSQRNTLKALKNLCKVHNVRKIKS